NSPKAQAHLNGGEIPHSTVVPRKLVNPVTGYALAVPEVVPASRDLLGAGPAIKGTPALVPQDVPEEELPARVHVGLGVLAELMEEEVEGSTENATVATALLSDLVERGLDPEQGMLFVIDRSKALRTAIRDVFGERAAASNG